MHHIIIAGGTGLVGKRLTQILIQKGYTVTILTRSKTTEKNNAAIHYATWDTITKTIEPAVFSTATAIVNLAGAGIAEKRWTTKRKREITESQLWCYIECRGCYWQRHCWHRMFFRIEWNGLLNDPNYKVQWLQEGDIVEMEIDQLGILTNTIVKEEGQDDFSLLKLKKM